jgi:hypothetical protein
MVRHFQANRGVQGLAGNNSLNEPEQLDLILVQDTLPWPGEQSDTPN